MSRASRRVISLTALPLLLAAIVLTPAGATTFTGGGVSIPLFGNGTPYPSTISVSGMASDITDVNVTITGWTHNFPSDTDLLLVGPTGTTIVFLSDVPNDTPACGLDISGVNLTFDDAAATSLTGTSSPVSGTFKPTNFSIESGSCGTDTDHWSAPAPLGPYGGALSAFNGTDPNGTWSLYVKDDSPIGSGSIASWSLDITAADQTPPAIGTVRDGFGMDIDTQTATNFIQGHWRNFGLDTDHFLWGGSTSSTCATLDVTGPFVIGGEFDNSLISTTLTIGTTYYNCVNAFDAAGNSTGYIASDGFTVVDGTNPTAGTVNDGSTVGTDIDTQANTTTIGVNWAGFSDNVGIAHYVWGASSSSSCATRDLFPDANVVTGGTSASDLASLPQGVTIYNCLRAVDAAGNQTAFVASDGFTIPDTTDPTPGTVTDGPEVGVDLDLQASTTELRMRWSGFSDNVEIDHYVAGFSTSPACATLDVVSEATMAGTADGFATVGLSLTPGTTYYGCLNALDAAGNETEFVATDGVTVANEADLEAGADDSGDPVPAGTVVTYTLRARNLGGVTAPNVEGTVQLPERAVLVSIVPEQGTCVGPRGLAAACDLGDIPAGETVEIAVTLRMTHAGIHRVGLLQLRSDLADPVSNNNSSREATTVTTNTTVVPGVNCTIVGTPQPETLNGTAGGDVICLLGGADVSDARAGADVVYGGAGGDRLTAGSGSDTLNGEAGNDTLHAIDSVSGNDAVHGGGGTDTCKKDAGDSATGCP